MFGTRENGELDPLRYHGQLDAPQEVARMDVHCGAGSVSRIIAVTRKAKIIGIKPDFTCREAAFGDLLYWRGARIRHGRPRHDSRFGGAILSRLTFATGCAAERFFIPLLIALI